MIKKIFKKNKLNNILRMTALIEAVVAIILIVITFSTKNAFLFKVLVYVGIITGFLAMTLLFLELMGIINLDKK